jgi:uncharacterized protein (DUF1697 family)
MNTLILMFWGEDKEKNIKKIMEVMEPYDFDTDTSVLVASYKNVDDVIGEARAFIASYSEKRLAIVSLERDISVETQANQILANISAKLKPKEIRIVPSNTFPVAPL